MSNEASATPLTTRPFLQVGDVVRDAGVDAADAAYDEGTVLAVTYVYESGTVEVYWHKAKTTYRDSPDDLVRVERPLLTRQGTRRAADVVSRASCTCGYASPWFDGDGTSEHYHQARRAIRIHERNHVPDFHRIELQLAHNTDQGRAGAELRRAWGPFLNTWRVVGIVVGAGR